MAVKKRKERARKEPEGQMSMLNTNTITTKDGVIRNIDKETHPKYAWAKTDEPGKLAYINKNILNVDSSYQRTLRDNTRLFIARNFSWAAFGVLSVANRSDGSLYVFDGQHRLAAAMERPSITQVPCVVFNVADIEHRLLAGVVYCEYRLRKVGLNLKPYRRKLVEAGREVVLREIHRTVEYRRVGGMTSWAEGVLNVVNHRLRNKISFDATTEAPEADVGDEE
jgi:hypothetical protein